MASALGARGGDLTRKVVEIRLSATKRTRRRVTGRDSLEGVVSTIDFHVTSECSQECPYCWGPRDFEKPVTTRIALRIVARVREVGARRIVFTGGDPLKREDTALLIRHAKNAGLEVALSTTGDELKRAFLKEVAPHLDLISLPLDGSTEAINSRTKEEGHFAAIMRSLEWLRRHPKVDVKLCTPVTRHNLADAPDLLGLVEEYAERTKARVFWNVFQAFPRAMGDVDWSELVVSDEEFEALRRTVPEPKRVRVNFLDHGLLDRLYVMVFPDGTLVVPRGAEYAVYGHFLEMNDFAPLLDDSRFDSSKHLRHSKGWEKGGTL